MDYSKSLKQLVRIAFVVTLVVGSVACGDDEDDGTSGQGGTSGMSGGSGGTGGSTGGTGGTGGSTGGTGGMGGTGGGMGGTGGVPPAMAATCGTSMCPIVSAGGNMLSACCPTEPANSCGAVTGLEGTTPICTRTGQEGVDVDAAICPTIKNALEMDAKGCCRPDGKCGFRSASLMGCIERSVYPEAFLSMMPATTAMFPLQEIACSADADAGM